MKMCRNKLGIEVTVLSVIVQTILLFEHPLFQEKKIIIIIVFQAFEHPRLKLSNIQTPTPYGVRMGGAKCLLAFNSLCGARMGCLLPFDMQSMN